MYRSTLEQLGTFPGTDQLDQMAVFYDAERRTVWAMFAARPRPSFNPDLLRQILQLGRLVRDSRLPVDFWVTGSLTPTMFSAGGDLEFFARSIRTEDRASLTSYARTSIDALWQGMTGFGVDAVTIALVEGSALGGGYECALAHDFLIVQEDAQLAFPEIEFNLFPGMGGYSLVARRANMQTVERLIGLAERHPAAWHEQKGLVDKVIAPGTGHATTTDFIDSLRPRLNGIRAMLRTRRRVFPVTYSDLMAITEDWVESAFAVGESNLAYMEQLAGYQDLLFAPARRA